MGHNQFLNQGSHNHMAQGFVGSNLQEPHVNIVGASQGNNQNQGTHIQNQYQMNNIYQGPSYHIIGTFPPNTPNDDILKRLHEME